MGPLEYVVIRFEGNQFTGQILPELAAVRNQNIIRLIDLLFVSKDSVGRLEVKEISDLNLEEARPYAALVNDIQNLLTNEDVEQAAHDLPNNSSAAILLFEHTWASRLKDAIRKANGSVVEEGWVPEEELGTFGAEAQPTIQG
ncbi:MAG TPA: DUF6325 family protein [Ktedonobacterales bacterium]|jgi:uncharacterized membrane protein